MAFTSCGTCYSFPIYLRVGGWVGLIARWVLLVQGCLRWTGGVCVNCKVLGYEYDRYRLAKGIVSFRMNNDLSTMLLTMLHWYLHTYFHCSNDMWVMSFEILIHITFHNDPFYLHRGLVILSSSSILQHSEHFSVFCYPSRGWHSVVTSVQQLQGIFYSFTCETHYWANILHWFFSWSYLCTWNVWPRWYVRL